jgi:vacuolar protein sorting-associated protein 35
LIRTEKQSDNSVADPSTEAFFSSTLRYIEFQKQKGGTIGEKYEQIKTSS